MKKGEFHRSAPLEIFLAASGNDENYRSKALLVPFNRAEIADCARRSTFVCRKGEERASRSSPIVDAA